jgi:hypothetical protein
MKTINKSDIVPETVSCLEEYKFPVETAHTVSCLCINIMKYILRTSNTTHMGNAEV